MNEKIRAVKTYLAGAWGVSEDAFGAPANAFFASDKAYFEMITFDGARLFVRANAEILPRVRAMLGATEARWAMDGDMRYRIDALLRENGHKLGGECLRFLFAGAQEPPRAPEGYAFRWYEGADARALCDQERFPNALNGRTDVLALGAYRDGELVALAGADDGCGDLWQIGVDTLPAHRGRGLANFLNYALAMEIERRGKIAFYTTWSANLPSLRAALRAGFAPQWICYDAESL